MQQTKLSTTLAAAIMLISLALQQGRSPRAEGPQAENNAARSAPRQSTESSMEMKQTVDGHKLRYLLQPPTGEKPEAGWPLLLFLHGYGECGVNLQLVKKHGPPKLNAHFDALAGCYIVSPQCPRDSWWRVAPLKSLVEEVLEDHPDIDRGRLYVTGLSMGGYGIWSFLSHYPDFFTAAVPICGGGDPLRLPGNRPPKKIGIENEFDFDGLKRAKNLPLWTFHGSADEAVPIGETEMVVRILKEAGSNLVRYTVYDGVGHVGSWERAYGDPELWKWLFSQR